jgi:hypothetical protein
VGGGKIASTPPKLWRLNPKSANLLGRTAEGISFSFLGPALRKKPCSRKVDKCGTVFSQYASDMLRVVRMFGRFVPKGWPLTFIAVDWLVKPGEQKGTTKTGLFARSDQNRGKPACGGANGSRTLPFSERSFAAFCNVTQEKKRDKAPIRKMNFAIIPNYLSLAQINSHLSAS